MAKTTNDHIRERNGINSKQDVIDLKDRIEELDRVMDENFSEAQHNRILKLRKRQSDYARFEMHERKIDREIEHLILYFTPELRKNMAELDHVISLVKKNE